LKLPTVFMTVILAAAVTTGLYFAARGDDENSGHVPLGTASNQTPTPYSDSPTPTPSTTPTPTETGSPTTEEVAIETPISIITAEPVVSNVPHASPPKSEHTPVPEPPVEVVYNDVQQAFFEGFRAAGGIYDEAHIFRVIRCESNWNVVTDGSYLGLAQFAEGTWATVATITGLWDWTNPYHQGFNFATWAMRFENPGAGQWPYCWWV
jgi:hypothetical protein